MGEIAARVCARLGVPCDPAAATAQHSYVSAATNSMTDLATADYYEGRIAGLPGGAVLTLSGRERLWQWQVEGEAGTAGRPGRRWAAPSGMSCARTRAGSSTRRTRPGGRTARARSTR